MHMLWFKIFSFGAKCLILVQFLLSFVMYSLPYKSGTMENKIETGSKSIKPRINCEPPRENRDKGDSTLTTRFYSKTKEFGFSTLKACSRAHFIIKLLCLVGHTKNKRACSH